MVLFASVSSDDAIRDSRMQLGGRETIVEKCDVCTLCIEVGEGEVRVCTGQ